MSDDKSTNSDIDTLSLEDSVRSEEAVDKSVTISLDTEAGKYYIFYKGKTKETVLTLGETLTMWKYMTNWLLSRADELDAQVDDDVSKHVLSAVVKKITDECEARRPAVKEKSLIEIP